MFSTSIQLLKGEIKLEATMPWAQCHRAVKPNFPVSTFCLLSSSMIVAPNSHLYSLSLLSKTSFILDASANCLLLVDSFFLMALRNLNSHPIAHWLHRRHRWPQTHLLDSVQFHAFLERSHGDSRWWDIARLDINWPDSSHNQLLLDRHT